MHSPTATSFAAVRETIRRAWRAQRDQRLLRAMSEQELRDLGIGRSEIPGLTGEPRPRPMPPGPPRR